ncbi:hypothetical protein BAUR9175_03704 [Brevibacterium aurantiacum]|uniref:Transposase n=1 Tax=Brevibacterium aurantiacum TaxID=273384 RepID=A0A2H1KPL3_BREAU|nr:hypothetical protein BAUR9175_03704 [Brevibacterium aurantiacum]
MPQPYPKEFRDDVLHVALNRDEKTTIAQIARTSASTKAPSTNGFARPRSVPATRRASPRTSPQSCANSNVGLACWNRRTKCCAAQPPISRKRICRQKALPARERARRRRDPRDGVVPGIEALTSALLPAAGHTDSRSRHRRGVSGQRALPTPTGTIRSSGTATWPTKLKWLAIRRRHGLRGGCARTMLGSRPLARVGQRMGRSLARPATTTCALSSTKVGGPGMSSLPMG